MTLPRRFLFLAAYAFWVGGFTFYAGVVVPLGTDVLGGRAEQALVTRVVSWYLNLTCGIALGVFLLEWLAMRGRIRAGLWLIMFACLCVLAWMHPRLDAMFDFGAGVLDRHEFRPWHRTYLWISTVQWGAALAFGVLTLAAWRVEDRFRRAGSTYGQPT
ncbi:MAG: hypothetical protein U0746_15005 [Gemmataceae bacterium]